MVECPVWNSGDSIARAVRCSLMVFVEKQAFSKFNNISQLMSGLNVFLTCSSLLMDVKTLLPRSTSFKQRCVVSRRGWSSSSLGNRDLGDADSRGPQGGF